MTKSTVLAFMFELSFACLAAWGETNYAFRARLLDLHPERVVALDAMPLAADEIAVDASWRMVPLSDTPVVRHAAKDLKDYLGKWKVEGGKDGVSGGSIEIAVDPTLKELQSKIEVGERRIRVTGASAREAYQGCIRLEDEMSTRGRPAVRRGSRIYTRLFSPRMTHSGYAVETFPDEYLDQLAHSGMDAILVFIEDPPDVTRAGKVDMNALVARAAKRGIDVWAYASFPEKAAKMHPLDPGAREWYAATYGAIVKNAPGLKGLICVGESCAFPSRDPGMGGYWWQEGWQKKGTKLNGFWPVSDWPEWLDLVKSVTREHNKDFEVVFWTYNWFKKPAELRLPLLEKIPTDLTLLVTWVRGDPPVRRGNAEFFVTDYSIAAPGPSAVFRSEADVAVRRGIPVMTISNTGGRTWDSGVAPYVPAPGRWKTRFDALRAAQKMWGVKALMESHHYGFQPNFISELAKIAFTAETTDADFDRALAAIAARDFGLAAAPAALDAWKDWDEAFAWHSTGDADFWGPLRVGPVYPLVLPGERLPPPLNPNLAKSEGVSKGTGWKYMMPKFVRPKEALDGEIDTCAREIALLEKGVRKLAAAMPLVPEAKRDVARRHLGVGAFYLASVRTLANVKRFYRAGLAKDSAAMLAVLDDEERNVREAMPLVEFDSALGWEPTMGYVCDRANLEWKLRQLTGVRETICDSGKTGRLTLAVRDRLPNYTIVLPEGPSPSQAFAAMELQKYVCAMTGVTLPIATNIAPERGIFLGGGARELGNDGFRLVATPPHFRIEGSGVHGTLFGVYDFLERHCGCEWLAPNLDVVPPRDSIEVSSTLDDVQRPAFLLRDLNWTDHLRNVGFAAKLKVNGFRIKYPEELGGRDHAKDTTTGGAIFDSLCPPGKYFKDHPDWFAMVGGQRRGMRAQRCLTNTGFLDFLVAQMKERLRKNYPRCKYYSIYPNDFKHNCQCADCKALDEREGSPSASLVHMANYVAERVSGEYPDVNILTFAYMYTLKPPKTMKVHPNVMICYCTDACDFSKPIRESRWKGCREFVENFRKWKELTDKIYIWDYSANFKYLFQPFECTHVMPANFRYFKEMGVFGVFEEGDHYGVKCVDEALKTWVIGHLLWNPEQPLEPLLDRFFKGYYGAASKVARGYYDALVAQERNRDEEKEPLVMWGTRLDDSFQPIDFFDEWSAKWTAALELVKDDPIRRENVYWARHNVDLVRLVRSKFGVKYSLLPGNVDDPKGERAALKPVAERVLADFARVEGLNKFRDSEMVRAHVEGLAMADLTGTGRNTDRIVVPAADLRVDDRTATRRVKDPLAAGGKAIRMGAAAPGAMHHCLSFHEDSFLKEPGVKIGVRVHARVEKTGVEKGTAFSVGTCDIVKYSKRDIRNFHVGMKKVMGDGYAWYDVEGTWSPAGSEKLWIGNGKVVDGENPCIKAVFFDQIELYRKTEREKGAAQ